MKSMLIIDGSESITTLLSDLFERRGWGVEVCSDRQCALERLTGDWPYEAILVGHVNGTEEVQLVGLIRGFEHRSTATVVVVAEHPELIDETVPAGADEVLLGPMNLNFLMWAVDRHVNR